MKDLYVWVWTHRCCLCENGRPRHATERVRNYSPRRDFVAAVLLFACGHIETKA